MRKISQADLAHTLRTIRGFQRNIREVASEIGISPASLSRLENGGIPSVKTLSLLTKWINLDVIHYLKTLETKKKI